MAKRVSMQQARNRMHHLEHRLMDDTPEIGKEPMSADEVAQVHMSIRQLRRCMQKEARKGGK